MTYSWGFRFRAKYQNEACDYLENNHIDYEHWSAYRDGNIDWIEHNFKTKEERDKFAEFMQQTERELDGIEASKKH